MDIKENTAWSCAHGVERWRSNCGCNSGQHADWHQEWRAPLRDALDWLRDSLAAAYEKDAGRLLTDPWEARDAYIEVVLERTPEAVERFLKRHRRRALRKAERIRVLKLLEMQRQAMLMYTSCGWFFDELSGLETVQVIQYAGRAVQLAAELFEDQVEETFVDKLALAKSNIPKHRDGGRIYAKWVKPARVDLKKAAAHYAISSFFEDYPETVSIFSYVLENLENRSDEAGRAKVAVGKARITSQITLESANFHYAVLHMGDHSISCGIHDLDEAVYVRMAEEVLGIFQKSDFPGLFQSIGLHFPGESLLPDLAVPGRAAQGPRHHPGSHHRGALTIYRQLYDNHVSLMRFINDSSSRIPKSLAVAGEIVINMTSSQEFGRAQLDYDVIQTLIEDAERAGINLEADTLEFTLRRNLERMARFWRRIPTTSTCCRNWPAAWNWPMNSRSWSASSRSRTSTTS